MTENANNQLVKSEQPANTGLIQSYDDAERVARAMVASGFFQDTKQISQALVKILAAREIGLGPFAGMIGVHIIQGKPAFGANIMASMVKSSGRYNYRVTEMTEKNCSIEFMEFFAGKWQTIGVSSFNLDDAKRAGTKNLDKFPRNMLFARAMSNGVRWYCPDIMNGSVVYTPEELGADVDEDGNVIDGIVEGDFQEEAPLTPAELSAAVQDTRSTREQVQADLPSLTLEEACKAVDSNGKPYHTKSASVVEKIISALWKQLLENNLTVDERAEALTKLASAIEILKAKKDGSLS